MIVLKRQFTATEGWFWSLWLESSLHGMYTILFGAHMYTTFGRSGARKRPQTLSSKYLLSVLMVLMYLIATSHICMAIVGDRQTFITNPDETKATAQQVSDPLPMAQLSLEVVNCLFADLIIIWRAWVLWGQNWRIVAFPGFLLTGTAVTSFIMLSKLATVRTEGTAFTAVFSAEVQTWAISFAVLTLTTNLLITILIAARIWYHNREMQRAIGRSIVLERYKGIILLIIESGAVYSAAWIIFIVLNVVNSPAVIIIIDCLAQLTGIVPTLIIFLCTIRRDVDTQRHATLSAWKTSSGSGSRPRRQRTDLDTDFEGFAMDGIPVRLQTERSSETAALSSDSLKTVPSMQFAPNDLPVPPNKSPKPQTEEV